MMPVAHVVGIAGSLDNLGLVAYDTGDYAEAARLFEEGLAIRRAAQWDWVIAISLTHLASVALAQEDEARADQLLQESLGLWEDWPFTLMQAAELQRRRGQLASSAANLAACVAAQPGTARKAARA